MVGGAGREGQRIRETGERASVGVPRARSGCDRPAGGQAFDKTAFENEATPVGAVIVSYAVGADRGVGEAKKRSHWVERRNHKGCHGFGLIGAAAGGGR